MEEMNHIFETYPGWSLFCLFMLAYTFTVCLFDTIKKAKKRERIKK